MEFLSSLHHWLLTCFFALIWSGLVDTETCPHVWLQIICGTYLNRTYIFASPAGLWKVVARVPVGCSYFSASIYWFYWSKISFKFFSQAFFSILLNFVYHIYFISVYWSWNLSLGVMENFQWAVSKPDILTWFLWRSVEVRGEGDSFCDCTCLQEYIDWIQGSSSSLIIFGGLL